MHLLDRPHHDGSALHLSNPSPELGEVVTAFVRVPRAAGVSSLHVRTTPNGEPRFVAGTLDRDDGADQWWRVPITVDNPVTGYRFLIDGGPNDYRWLNAYGVVDHDVPDVHDFRLVTYAAPPAWLADTVVYQIFPDRFASSGTPRHWPEWARVSAWDEPVDGRGHHSTKQVYGGDLPGAEAHLDHIERVGANLVYFTPFFPARSSHRYDAMTFDHVDDNLGGDAALASFSRAAHARGIRVIGDLTTNHSGDAHTWFTRAQADASSPEADFYIFREHPDDYEAWFGVRSLPKFDLRSAELRRRLYQAPDSIVARFLDAPFGLDGWRIDVANMTGRLGGVDVNHDVARGIRQAMDRVRPGAWLLAEHCHDASRDLDADGWHGTMNYAGFTRPVWSWLNVPGSLDNFLGMPTTLPVLPGPAVAAAMRQFGAVISWRALNANMILLDSHDTPRMRTVVGGDTGRQLVAAAMLFTLPGVPSVFQGDEIGIEGRSGDETRRPFPWDESHWNRELLTAYERLVRLRRNRPALRHGGLRWVHVGDDSLTYLRESREERLLVHVSRAPHAPVRLPAGLLGGAAELLYGSHDLARDGAEAVLPADGPTASVWNIG